MADSLPTFRRLGAGLSDRWARFSYADSIVAQGGVWTLICWLPAAVLAVLPQSLVSSWTSGSKPAHFWQDPSAAVFLLIFPGSLLGGFIAGAVLCGRAAGFLDSLKRGLKAAAVLACAITVFAALMFTSSDPKAPVAAVIFLFFGIGAALAGMFGAFMRWLGDRSMPATKQQSGDKNTPETVGQTDGDWLAAVAEELAGAGLFDYATALAVHKALQASGRTAPDAPPALGAEYEEIFTKLQALFPGKKREDWLEANALLRKGALLTAKAGGGAKAAREAMRDCCPELGDGFYEWVADRARQLP